MLVFFSVLSPLELKWEFLHGLNLCFLNFSFFEWMEWNGCKKIFSQCQIFNELICLLLPAVSQDNLKMRFFQEFSPAVNIYIYPVAINPNNFLISNAVCKSQVISPVAVLGTLCT